MLKRMVFKRLSLMLIIIMVMSLALSLVSFAGDEEWPWGTDPTVVTMEDEVSLR